MPREWKANIRIIIELLSERLYEDRKVAIRELVANAIDSGAKNIYLEIFGKKHLNKQLSVKDDGTGMCSKEVDQYLLSIGRSLSRKYKSKIGEHGIGFIASFAVSEWVLVETIKERERTVLLLNKDGVIIELSNERELRESLLEWINKEAGEQCEDSRKMGRFHFEILKRQLFEDRLEGHGTRITLFSPMFRETENLEQIVTKEVVERFSSIKPNLHVNKNKITHIPLNEQFKCKGKGVTAPYGGKTKDNEFYFKFPEVQTEPIFGNKLFIKDVYNSLFVISVKRCELVVNSTSVRPTLTRDTYISDEEHDKFEGEALEFIFGAIRETLRYECEHNIKKKEMHTRWLDFLISNHDSICMAGSKRGNDFLQELLKDDEIKEMVLKLQVPMVSIPKRTRAKPCMELGTLIEEGFYYIIGENEGERTRADYRAEEDGDLIIDLDKIPLRDRHKLIDVLTTYFNLTIERIAVEEKKDEKIPPIERESWSDFLEMAKDMLSYMNPDAAEGMTIEMADLPKGNRARVVNRRKIQVSINEVENINLRNIIENIVNNREAEKTELFDFETETQIHKPDSYTVTRYLVEVCRELWADLSHELAHATLGVHDRAHPAGFEHEVLKYDRRFKEYRLEGRHIKVLRRLTIKKTEGPEEEWKMPTSDSELRLMELERELEEMKRKTERRMRELDKEIEESRRFFRD